MPNLLILKKSLELFPKLDKVKLLVLTFIQISLAVFDLLALALVGILGGLLISVNASNKLGNRTQKIIDILGLSGFTLQTQISIFGTLILLMFTIKTVASIYILKKISIFMSSRAAKLATEITSKFLNQPLVSINKLSMQENIYILSGFSANIRSIITLFSTILSDFFLTTIIILGLIYVDYRMTLISLLMMSIVVICLYLKFKRRSFNQGLVKAYSQIGVNEIAQESILGYRAIRVSGRLPNFVEKIKSKFFENAINDANILVIPLLNKYLVELTMYLVIYLLAIFKFLTSSFSNSIAAIAIFLVAITRLAPALLRIQQNFLALNNLKGLTAISFNYIEELRNIRPLSILPVKFNTTHKKFNGLIEIKNVKYSYPQNTNFQLDIPNLSIKSGDQIAIVGRSGSGKSTLVDLLLGVIEPKQGEILISGMKPSQAFENWPGAISYVPQDVHIFNGTLKDALCMGLDPTEVSDHDIENCLESVNLLDMFAHSPLRFQSEIGDRGTKLSGGQKQRLSLARSLITKPKMLVLDEATSALDSENEYLISELLNSMKGKITIIVIAHRLSTVRNSEKILYMDSGRILSFGNFEEVRKLNQDFDKQAQLSGY